MALPVMKISSVNTAQSNEVFLCHALQCCTLWPQETPLTKKMTFVHSLFFYCGFFFSLFHFWVICFCLLRNDFSLYIYAISENLCPDLCSSADFLFTVKLQRIKKQTIWQFLQQQIKTCVLSALVSYDAGISLGRHSLHVLYSGSSLSYQWFLRQLLHGVVRRAC